MSRNTQYHCRPFQITFMREHTRCTQLMWPWLDAGAHRPRVCTCQAAFLLQVEPPVPARVAKVA